MVTLDLGDQSVMRPCLSLYSKSFKAALVGKPGDFITFASCNGISRTNDVVDSTCGAQNGACAPRDDRDRKSRPAERAARFDRYI